MYELKVIDTFSAAHALRGYKGECERIHGHNYKVEVILKGDTLDDVGMLVDFKEVKKYLKKTIEPLDHNFLNELSPFVELNPTSENIAKYIYSELKNIFKNKIDSVIVWENFNNASKYYE
ncbi:MAG: 6-carboxytetrahydropterin synthase QueD [Deferribacterota bacterium]|nr:6-carboxytetrahydropterin synthase QueD [Deferribacterota bacterium]